MKSEEVRRSFKPCRIAAGMLLTLLFSASARGQVPPGAKLWEFTTGGPVYSSPAIGPDGTVYVGSLDGKVYALDGATGAERWEFTAEPGGAISSSPAIGTDGTAYVGSWDTEIYALDGVWGTNRWKFATGWGVASSPAIAANGTVYVSSLDNKIYALDGTTGSNSWQFAQAAAFFCSPVIGADGTVYIGTHDHTGYALDGATGSVHWTYPMGNDVPPAIGADGTVYVPWGSLYAMDALSGQTRWVFTADGYVSSPAIGVDGTVYVGSVGQKVYAVDGLLGLERWEFATGGPVRSSPAIGTDGTVYVSSEDGKMYAIDGNTGAELWEFVTGSVSAGGGIFLDSCPALGTNGAAYVGSSNGKVYAVQANSGGGLAGSPWPMFQQNAQHTGRAVPPTGGTVQINLDLTQPGVSASNVVARSVFALNESQPISYGPVGIGSFSTWASVTIPFTVSAAGAYRLVVTYGLTKQMRPITVNIDGAPPDASWQNVTLWATTPDYASLGGAAAMQLDPQPDCTSRHLVCWTLSGTPVTLAPGPHTIELIFPEGDIVATQLLLTTDPPPVNPPKPWTLDSYVPFPALDFTNRLIEPVGGRLRMTFQGVWQNLAPNPVSFLVSATVMPRKGEVQPLYQVTDIQPAPLLALDIGERVPFQLTVESTGPVPDMYSELIQLNLASLDVTNLFKPYLMCAANGYLSVRPDMPFHYVFGYQNYLAVQDGTDPQSVIPTRTTLDFSAGYPNRTLTDAFVYALANAPQRVFSQEIPFSPPIIANYTSWAQAGAPATWTFDNSSEPAINWSGRPSLVWNHPLAYILAAQGQPPSTIDELKAMMVLLSQEMPYYPLGGQFATSTPLWVGGTFRGL